jgi:hypothetical protein
LPTASHTIILHYRVLRERRRRIPSSSAGLCWHVFAFGILHDLSIRGVGSDCFQGKRTRANRFRTRPRLIRE